MNYRYLVLAVTATLVVMAAAPAAMADPPDLERVEFTEPSYLGDCGDFEALGLDDLTFDIKVFYKGGEIDRIHYHADIDGIVYNSLEPDKQLPATAHYNFVQYAENFDLFIQTGLFGRINMPGGGVLLVDAGFFIVELIDGEPVFLYQAGNHQLLDGDIADVCAALS